MKSARIVLLIVLLGSVRVSAQELQRLDSLPAPAESLMSSAGEARIDRVPQFMPGQLMSGVSSSRYLRRPSPPQWRPTDMSSVRFSTGKAQLFIPVTIRPFHEQIDRHARIAPLDYVERTQQSWWPHTFR